MSGKVFEKIQLKWDIRQRLAMLEASILWEGRVTSTVLMQLFGISRGQASKDFSLYHQLAEGNVIYDRNQKAYFPSNTFKPRFMRGTAEEYFRLIEAGSYLGQSVVLPITPTQVGVEVIQPPHRKFDFRILKLVHQAIREKRQLKVNYQSLNREQRELYLEPHTLVYNGFRWHIRAYSLQHHEFGDFVLARILCAFELGESSVNCIEQDQNWQIIDALLIAPHPELSPEQQTVVAEDYGMENGILQLMVRRALKLYYLRMLHLDETFGMPKIQQIIWLNRDEEDIGKFTALEALTAQAQELNMGY